MLIMGLFTARVFIKILRIPQVVFLPIVMVLTTIGSFSVGGGVNDLYLMLGVGFVASFVNLLKYPTAPLVIGVILGSFLMKRSAGRCSSREVILPSLPPARLLPSCWD